MERTEVLDLMSGLKLYGMRSAYDETLATALKRKHEPQRFVGDLLKAEFAPLDPQVRPAVARHGRGDDEIVRMEATRSSLSDHSLQLRALCRRDWLSVRLRAL